MNEDIIHGKWMQIKGTLKTQFAKLTDNDLERAEGNREYLIGKLQERYGWQKDQAQREVDNFERSLRLKQAA